MPILPKNIWPLILVRNTWPPILVKNTWPPILLKNIWPIKNLDEYKIYFARRDNQGLRPLDVWVRDRKKWQDWVEYPLDRNHFNRPLIFSLMQFNRGGGIWLFGGVFKVLERHFYGENPALDGKIINKSEALERHFYVNKPEDKKVGYKVKLTDKGEEFIGRLKIRSSYRSQPPRINMGSHYHEFKVQEILREPYSGRSFCGYDEIDLSFVELEGLINNDSPDWKAALENVKGIYLFTDTKTGKHYVGSAYGNQGIWSRWKAYIETGDGGNKEIHKLIKQKGPDYCRSHFRFALLEQRQSRTPNEKIWEREDFWKSILLTRGEQGLNRN